MMKDNKSKAELLRKQEETKLFKIASRYKALLSAIPDIIMEVDNDRVYTWANQAGFDFFGEDVIGKEAAFYFEGEQETYNIVQPLFNGSEDVFYVESWQRRNDGKKRLLGWWCNVLKDKNGNVSGALSSARDITEHHQAEEALKESQSLYFSFIEQLPNAVFRKDRKGRYVLVNSQFCRLKNLKEEEIIGLKPMEIANNHISKKGEQHQATKYANVGEDIHEQILKTGKSFAEEEEYPAPDGSTIYMHVIRMPVTDVSGKIIGTQGILFDITERKLANKELKEYKDLFSAFMQHSPVYTFIKEVSPTESRVLQASDNFRDMVGISGSEMTGKTMDELFPPEFATKITADDWGVVKKGKVLQIDEDLNGRNYTTIKFPIIKGDKNLLAGYTIDITERKQAEENIRQKDEQFKTLFMSISEGFYISEVIYDDNGDPCDYRYLEVNPQFEKIVGMGRDQIIGKRYKELVPIDTTQWLNNYCTVASTGIQQSYEFYSNEYKKHFGTYSYSPIKGQVIVFVIDITERKQAEEELKKHRENLEELVKERTTELEEKNKELENFNNLFVGREFRIKELKDKVIELEQRLQDLE
ncbi:MAG: PAS domain S-box protein [Mariniphaga sp.]|nr:PAS domain S-box protein [Mariniphaga sp.]